MYKDFEPLLKDLPEGWSAEPYLSDTVVLMEKKGCGFVSISTVTRTFALGICEPEYRSAEAHSGRAWKKRLLNSAMAALNATREDKQ